MPVTLPPPPSAPVAGTPDARMADALRRAAAASALPVALYGAGAHTAKVLAALHAAGDAIAAFVEDAPRVARVCGWPVVRPGQLPALGVRGVILNSDAHEAALWKRRNKFESLGLRVFRLYADLAPPAAPRTLPDIEAAMRGGRALPAAALRAYWESRGSATADASNAPDAYLARTPWSILIADWLAEAGVPRDARICELGCNVGRNLALLHQRGYARLTGIEINPCAVRAAATHFPNLARSAELRVASLDDALPALPDGAFDAVLTLGTLMCLPPESAALLPHARRIAARWLLTVEDEATHGPRHTPRDYGALFTGGGWAEARTLHFSDADPDFVALYALQPGFTARLFARN